MTDPVYGIEFLLDHMTMKIIYLNLVAKLLYHLKIFIVFLSIMMCGQIMFKVIST